MKRQFSKWLSTPFELGEKPRRIHIRYEAMVKIDGHDDVEYVTLLDYEMRDGSQGGGFNGPCCFSFCDVDHDKVEPEDLIISYLGMYLMISQSPEEVHQLEPEVEETIESIIKKSGFEDVEVHESIICNEVLYTLFNAKLNSHEFKGCIYNGDEIVSFEENNALSNIPAYYYAYGKDRIEFQIEE
ncbi:hypothetical protein Pan54_36700 [Rubinisphaera italica]|uniref:Uncharacterized protein n=2 Tax=Rubinisphaera italica TaxID=2527969 RepID=A0A5C5XK50_9PLAN|nr:hypothetical protein Pan54_36700 [Rubinisphaera italica]